MTPTGASLIRALCGLSSLFRDQEPSEFNNSSSNSNGRSQSIERDYEDVVLERLCKLDKTDFDEELRRRVGRTIDVVSPTAIQRYYL